MKNVLITGAAGGIGKCLAFEFGRAGYDLTLIDKDWGHLQNIVRDLEKENISVIGYDRDITYYNSVIFLKCPNILINNAGIPYNGAIKNMTIEDFKKLVEVNLIAPVRFMIYFLPKMKDGGYIVNISSGQAFFRLPSWGAYSAIKAAFGIISELLSYELDKVKVITIYPFMVNTPFYYNISGDTLMSKLAMKFLPLYSDSPEKVAKKIFNAIEKGKRIEYINPINFLGIAIRAFPPIANMFTYITNKLFIKR